MKSICDDRDPVHVPDIVLDDSRVVVDVVIHATRAHDEAGHGPAWVYYFAAVVDGSALEQRQQPVGPHLGVNTQVTMALECGQDSVGDRPNAHLKGSPVLHERGRMMSNRLLRLAGARGGELREGLVVLD